MRAFAWVWLGAAVVLGGPARAQQAVAVPAWSNLFNQTSGWTGADGIFSHLADGWDAPNDPHPNPTTLFIFNDTFIGTVNPAGQREGGWSLPHNTGATLPGVQPNPATIGFFWGNMTGTPQAVVSPATPQSLPGEWYWHLLLFCPAHAADQHWRGVRLRGGRDRSAERTGRRIW
jgi:hypothetical protein